jgi:acyl carrier protein
MNQILVRQGKGQAGDSRQNLRELGFRSLDFSELALRVEQEIGRELNFDASKLRAIARVSDVLEFFEQASQRA